MIPLKINDIIKARFMTRTTECISLLNDLQVQLGRIDAEMDRAWQALDDGLLRQAFAIAGDLAGMLEHAARLSSRLAEAAERRIKEGEAGTIPGILADHSASALKAMRIRESRVLELLDRALMRKDEEDAKRNPAR